MSRRALRLILLALVPLLAVAGGLHLWLTGGRYVSTENAYVKNDIVVISTVIDGRVTEVAVEDHERVEAGDILFRIDPEPLRIALAETEAELTTVANRLSALRAEFRGARVELAEAEERVRFLDRQAARTRNLEARGAATSARLDEAQFELAVARERVGAIRAKMAQILATLGGDIDLPTEHHPMYLEARARRDRAAYDLQCATVRAPTTGIVMNMKLQPGEYVEAGDAIFSIVVSERPWIEANLKETELTHVRVGQAAEIIADAYPDRPIRAVVESISPATGAEFAVLPPQNATGNWIKVVQRLPVRLRLVAPPADPPLRAGMTVRARIDTGRQRSLSALIGTVWAGGQASEPRP